MLKKIIFFILVLILISLLFFTWCIFYWPCKTKIIKYIPDNYQEYLNITKTVDSSKEKKIITADLNDNAEKEVLDETLPTENTEIIENTQDENKIKDEIKDLEEEIEENKKDEKEIENKKEELENTEKNLEENEEEKNKVDENKINEDEEKKLDENKVEENEISEEEKLKKEKIIKKMKERAENKRKALEEEENEVDSKKLENEEKTENSKSKKKISFVAYVDWQKKVLEVEKFLWNWVYYTTNWGLYLWNKNIKKVENIDAFQMKKIWDSIALLEERKWTSKEIYLIDIEKKDFYKIYENSKLTISRAEKYSNKIVFMLKSNYIDWWLFIFDTKTKKSEKVFSNSENNIKSDSFSYKRITDFNVFPWNIWNSLIEVTYEWQNNEEMKKIIWGLK